MLTLLTPATVEPVTAAEARLAARFDGSDLDAFIAGAISAARSQAEQITGRRYAVQTLRDSWVDWPTAADVLYVHAATACAISYWTGSAFAVLSPANYVFDVSADGRGTVIASVTGTSLPALAARPVGPRVRIDLTAGASPAAVPEAVKLYIKAQVAAWIKNPEAIASNTLARQPLFDSLLDAERLWV